MLQTIVKGNADSAQVTLSGKTPAMVAGRYDNGYWISVDKERYLNTSKLSLANGTDSGAYFKFRKALFPSAGGELFDQSGSSP